MAPYQPQLTSFFRKDSSKTSPQFVPNRATSRENQSKRLRIVDGSHFGTCPLCQARFPFHQLENHAASCEGEIPKKLLYHKPPTVRNGTILPCSEPLPGLYFYKEFISPEEEHEILVQLDERSTDDEFLAWKPAHFNGQHAGKRWGVHCNLRDRKVYREQTPLPRFVTDICIPKLQQCPTMRGVLPNECNAIDYRREKSDYLKSHVDDRKLSLEPIANLSLAGDCYMTFTNVAPERNMAVALKRVFLPRRCLLVLTGKARYDFAHGIEAKDIVSPRRVSITMRRSPLTETFAATT